MPAPLPPLCAIWSGSSLAVEGELCALDQLRGLPDERELRRRGPVAQLDLGELDIESGPALARLLSWIRRLPVPPGAPLRILEAPQMLAHTLYKVGMLEDRRILLVRPRMDEGTTAN